MGILIGCAIGVIATAIAVVMNGAPQSGKPSRDEA
jgi:gas vesicle protein